MRTPFSGPGKLLVQGVHLFPERDQAVAVVFVGEAYHIGGAHNVAHIAQVPGVLPDAAALFETGDPLADFGDIRELRTVHESHYGPRDRQPRVDVGEEEEFVGVATVRHRGFDDVA